MASNVIGQAIIEIAADATGFVKNVDKEVKGPLTKITNTAGKVVKSTFKAAGTIVGATFATAFGIAMAKGFKRLKDIDTAEAKLTGLGIVGKQQAEVMQNALESVSGTVYGLGDAALSASQFVAAGIKPGADLTRTMKVLASTASVTGDELGDMTQILGAVATTNKLTGKSLAQLQQRGIPVLQYIQDEYQVTAEEATKMVSRGQVDFEALQTMLEKNLGPAAQAMGQSFEGMVANMNAALGRIGANLLKPVFYGLKEIVPEVTALTDALNKRLGPAAEAFGEKIGDAVSKRAVPAIQDLADVINGQLPQANTTVGKTALAFQGLFNYLSEGRKTNLSIALGLDSDSAVFTALDMVKRAFTDIRTTWNNFITGVQSGMSGGLWTQLLEVFSQLRPLLSPVSVLFESIGKAMADAGGSIGESFGKVIQAVLDFAMAMSPIAEVVGEFLAIIGDSVARVLPSMTGALENIAEAFVNLLTAAQPLIDVLSDVLRIGGELFTVLINLALGAVLPIIDGISRLVLWLSKSEGGFDLLKGAAIGFAAVIGGMKLAGFITTLYKAVTALGAKTAAFAKNMIAGTKWMAFQVKWVAWNVKNFIVTMAKNTAALVTNAAIWGKNMAAMIAHKTAQVASTVATNAATVAQRAFNLVMNANPIMLVVAAITTLVGVLTWFFTQTEIGRQVWQSFMDFLVGLWNGVVEIAQAVWGAVADFFSDIWNTVKDATTAVWNTIKDFLTGIWNGLKTTFESVWGAVRDFFTNMWNAIKDFAKSTWDNLKTILSWNPFTLISNLWQSVLNWFRDLPGKIGGFLSGLWNKVKSPFITAKQNAQKQWQGLLNWFKDLPSAIGRAFKNIWDVVSAPFKHAFNKIAEFWNNTVGKLNWTVPSWVPGIGGNKVGAPKLPMLAKGGLATAEGWSIIGERGPELLHMPKGASVVPLSHPAAENSIGGAGGNVVNADMSKEMAEYLANLIVVGLLGGLTPIAEGAAVGLDIKNNIRRRTRAGDY